MREGKYTIYALIDPRDHLPFYIGQTADKGKRFEQHCNPKEEDTTLRAKRIREIKANGYIPQIVVLQRLLFLKMSKESPLIILKLFLRKEFMKLEEYILIQVK